MKEAAYKGLVPPILEYRNSEWDPNNHDLTSRNNGKRFKNLAARFVTGHYVFEAGSMTGIFGQLKWESLKKKE